MRKKVSEKMKKSYNFKFKGLYIYFIVIIVVGMIVYISHGKTDNLDVLGSIIYSVGISCAVNLLTNQFLGENDLEKETQKQFEFLLKLYKCLIMVQTSILSENFDKIRNKIKENILKYYINVSSESSMDDLEEFLEKIYKNIIQVNMEIARENSSLLLKEIEEMVDNLDNNHKYRRKFISLYKYDLNVDSM